MNKKKTKKKEDEIKIYEVASFECSLYQNAINIAIATAQAGRFVNILNSGTGYIVRIYSRNPND